MNNKFIRCIGLIIIIFKYYYSPPSPILSKAFSRILVSPTLKVSFLNCFTVCKEKKTDLSCLKETSSASIVENHDATLESSFGYFSSHSWPPFYPFQSGLVTYLHNTGYVQQRNLRITN